MCVMLSATSQCLPASGKPSSITCVGRTQVSSRSVRHHALPQRPAGVTQDIAQHDAVLSKRSLLVAGLALATFAGNAAPAQADAAQAIVEFWKSRQTQNSDKLLAPIKVAQRRLADAAAMLDQPSGLGQALQTVRASSMNCYVFDALSDDTIETKASLFTQEFKLSDPCTFRLIIKNITALSPVEVRAAAYDQVDALVRSYQKLDAYLEMASEGSPDALGKAKDQLAATLQTTYDIEETVRTVLGVPA